MNVVHIKNLLSKSTHVSLGGCDKRFHSDQNAPRLVQSSETGPR